MKLFTKNTIKFSRNFFRNIKKFQRSQEAEEEDKMESLLKRILINPKNEEVSEDLMTLHNMTKNNPSKMVEISKRVAKLAPILEFEGHQVGYNFKKKPVRVAVTGAAGNISYSLLFRIAGYFSFLYKFL
jgi:hypothetical protein